MKSVNKIIFLLAACLIFRIAEAGEEVSCFIPVADSKLNYCGPWNFSDQKAQSSFVGSRIMFKLDGAAFVLFSPTASADIYVKDEDGARIVRPQHPVVIQSVGGEEKQVCRIPIHGDGINAVVLLFNKGQCSMSALKRKEKPESITFQGLLLDEGASLLPNDIDSKESLLFVGDSITSGIGLAGDGVEGNVSQSYAYLLSVLLDADYQIVSFPGASCDDLSVTSSKFSEFLESDNHFSPGVIFLNIGANDLLMSESKYTSCLLNAVKNMRLLYPESVIAVLNFFRMYPDRSSEQMKMTTLENVYYYNARPYIVGYAADGIHPNAESHQLLAENLAEWLSEQHIVHKD